jgi:tripartite motif-containing protein 2/3
MTSQLRVQPVRGPALAPKAETAVASASKRPRSSAPTALFDKFKFPEFCIFDSNGNIVVSDHNSHCIRVLRYCDGTILRSFGRADEAGDDEGSFQNPCAFVMASGLIFVADYGNHRVQVLNYATGEFVRSIRYVSKDKSSETYPTSVAINRDGNKVAVKFSNGKIQVFQVDGKLVSTFGRKGNGDCQFSGEGHIAYDKNDNIVVSDCDNNRIQVLTSNGSHLRSIGIRDGSGGFKHPVGFTFNESGDQIIVADCANNRVQILQYPDGSHIRTIGSSMQLNRPYHVCIDCEKRYVVCDSGHGKLQFFT